MEKYRHGASRKGQSLCLDVQGLNIAFAKGEKADPADRGRAFQVYPGEIVSIVKSGCGKSIPARCRCWGCWAVRGGSPGGTAMFQGAEIC